MEFWDLFVSVVMGGAGGAVLAYALQTRSEKALSLFALAPIKKERRAHGEPTGALSHGIARV